MHKNLDVREITSFKKDIKLIKKRNLPLEKLQNVVLALRSGKKLPRKLKDHALKGNYRYHRECHITPDWLLIYQIDRNELVLVRTGSHADLFK